MAVVKLNTTKVANKAISYAEKRAEVANGVNCIPEVAKAQMKATRTLRGKDDGIQAHTVIQSFDKDAKLTPEQVNEAGVALAEKIAPGHESVVYTHTDKDHSHNHIVINSVHLESGKKYHAHGKEAFERVRDANDDICRERGFSVPEKEARLRYTMAENEMDKQGKPLWKDEIREHIEGVKKLTNNLEDFKFWLKELGVEVIERGKNFTYLHLETNNKVRGSRLGEDYKKEIIEKELTEHEFEKPERKYDPRNNNWDERLDELSRKVQAERDREAERIASRKARTDGKSHEGHERGTAPGTSRDEEKSRGHERASKNQRRSHERDKGGLEL